MRHAFMAVLLGLVWPGSGFAGQDAPGPGMAGADVIILGEVHDNPVHHEVQAELVRALRPGALVFEMLTADQAARITDNNRNSESDLRAALAWERSGWPDFAMYFPIFAAAPQARIYGAGLPREAARAALEAGIIDYFGEDAAAYGLDRPLDGGQRAARLDYQAEVHCGALPEPMLPQMVDLQRLRDAMLARVVVQALAEAGRPVVVITGNGHARKDWGLAAYLSKARPDLAIFALGQSEGGEVDGLFDEIRDAPAVERPDPCLAFEKAG